MKKQQLILTALLFSFGFANSQSQQKNWYISPVKVEMTLTQPVVSTLNQPLANAPVPAPGQSFGIANGYYDKIGNLIFYLVNDNIYDQYNTLIGSTPAGGGSEIIIVPFDNNDNCQLKFNIFTTSSSRIPPLDNIKLNCTVLDMKSYSVQNYTAETISYPIAPNSLATEFGAIACTKRNAVSGEYYLYFMASPGTVGFNFGQIKKVIVHPNGTVNSTTNATHACVYPDNLATPPVTNANASAEVFSRELEVLEYLDNQHPGYLAWASFVGSTNSQLYRYHYLQLDVHGEYINNSYTEFNIPNSTANNAPGFRGVELYRAANGTVKLFMGTGSAGIYATDLPLSANPVFSFVTGSQPYGNSQIERAYNGNMYASSANGIVGTFNPGIFPLSMSTGSFTISNPPNIGWQGAPLYTLPDQLDGQNYDDLPTCTCTFIPTASVQNVIGGNTVWSPGTGNPWNTTSDIQIIKEIHLSGNATLTIQNMTFRFSPNARVLIDAGSTLILENTVFTSDYDFENCPQPYSWKGITVLGNNAANQYTANAQGKLVLKPGSLVKFAECGASICNPLTTGNASNGGIINVFDGSFINCKTGVEFKPYSNYKIVNGISQSVGNLSRFTDSEFRCDGFYPFSAAPIGVKIDGCQGLNFTGCAFNANAFILNQLNSYGIKSFNSGVTVNGNTNFLNLYRGIGAFNTTSKNTLRVLYSNFEDNQTGINIQGINNVQIQRCSLLVSGNNYNSIFNSGITLNHSSGYIVEENNFNISINIASNKKFYGILNVNSGSADNQIYKNDFQNLSIGNFASGINCNNKNPALYGLQYLCNSNTFNSDYDFYIIPKTLISPGIKSIQGTNLLPAGNSFSQIAGTFSDINNLSNTVLGYNYYNGSSVALPIAINNVTPLPSNNINDCPSHIRNDPAGLYSNNEYNNHKEAYEFYEVDYLSLLYVYNQLMDGGSTNALLNQIQQSWSSNAMQLRSELLARSPFLTKNSIEEAAHQNILSPAVLLEICLANPDGTRDQDLLHLLQYEINNPLSQVMIDMIIASWEASTMRTSMEHSLSELTRKISMISNSLLADLFYREEMRSDTVMPDDTLNTELEIKFWLNRTQTITAKYDLILLYFERSAFSSAEAILNAIPFDFNLSDDQLQDYNDFVTFYNLLKAYKMNGFDLSLLDQSQINQWTDFAMGGETYGRARAYNMLCFYYGICPEEDYGTSSSGSRISYLPQSSEVSENYQLKATPNPASNFVDFNYKLNSNIKDNCMLVIQDNSGKIIDRFKITEMIGTLKWDTSNQLSGIYHYMIYNGNEKSVQGKITIAH